MELNEVGKVVFWVLSVSIFLYEIRQMILGNSSKNWKSHPAKAFDVSIKTRVDEGTEENRPCIKYQYHYLGALYNGSKVKFGNLWFSNYGKAGNMLKGVINGGEITIYVNPKNPKQSVLYRGYEGSILWFFIFFSIFFYVAFKS